MSKYQIFFSGVIFAALLITAVWQAMENHLTTAVVEFVIAAVIAALAMRPSEKPTP